MYPDGVTPFSAADCPTPLPHPAADALASSHGAQAPSSLTYAAILESSGAATAASGADALAAAATPHTAQAVPQAPRRSTLAQASPPAAVPRSRRSAQRGDILLVFSGAPVNGDVCVTYPLS